MSHGLKITAAIQSLQVNGLDASGENVKLDDIRPSVRHQVFDLVQQAGFDVMDWIASSKDPRGHKANPKYCYEWSFIQPGKLVILNLWHSAMTERDGRIVQRNNFRADAEHHRAVTRKGPWVRRAKRLDEACRQPYAKTCLSE